MDEQKSETKEAYQLAAFVVTKYGDAYLPIFKRLHSEMERIGHQEKIKALALSVVADRIATDATG